MDLFSLRIGFNVDLCTMETFPQPGWKVYCTSKRNSSSCLNGSWEGISGGIPKLVVRVGATEYWLWKETTAQVLWGPCLHSLCPLSAPSCVSCLLMAVSAVSYSLCWWQGQEPFVSTSGLHQLYILIFLMAAVHVVYSCITMLLTLPKVQTWTQN